MKELHFGDKVRFTSGFYKGHEGIVFEQKYEADDEFSSTQYYRIYVKHDSPDVPSSIVEITDMDDCVKVKP
jgi:hypothetical protein